ncbi:MAG TPA: hypothetical protein VMT30_07090 [Candidatus Saccharimonadia bacterium]|nr:hypothetical protein [Candidatus Saccharimonadia bacterium]
MPAGLCGRTLHGAPAQEHVADAGTLSCNKALRELKPVYLNHKPATTILGVAGSCAADHTAKGWRFVSGTLYCFPRLGDYPTVYAAMPASANGKTNPASQPLFFIEEVGDYFWVFQADGLLFRIPVGASILTSDNVASWRPGKAGWEVVPRPSFTDLAGLLNDFHDFLDRAAG